MFTKKIYFSGENLAIIFKNLSGVVKILPGIINSKFNGVEVQFNPKKIDLSTLMDNLFAEKNPYAEKNNLGIFYTSQEDEPQIELYINFISTRGKEAAATSAEITINDTTLTKNLARRTFVKVERLKNFSAEN